MPPQPLVQLGTIVTKLKEQMKQTFWNFDTDYDFVSYYENKILSLGYQLKFPINVNPDKILAHRTPTAEDKIPIKDMKIVSLDIGVCNGSYTIDTAITLTRDPSLSELLLAYRSVIDQLELKLQLGLPISDIAKFIKQNMTKLGLDVDPSYHGHYIGKKKLHVDPTIYNVPTDFAQRTVLKEGVFTIEPHCTIGNRTYTKRRKSNIVCVGNYYIRSTDGNEYCTETDRLSFFEERVYYLSVDTPRVVRIS